MNFNFNTNLGNEMRLSYYTNKPSLSVKLSTKKFVSLPKSKVTPAKSQ